MSQWEPAASSSLYVRVEAGLDFAVAPPSSSDSRCIMSCTACSHAIVCCYRRGPESVGADCEELLGKPASSSCASSPCSTCGLGKDTTRSTKGCFDDALALIFGIRFGIGIDGGDGEPISELLLFSTSVGGLFAKPSSSSADRLTTMSSTASGNSSITGPAGSAVMAKYHL